MNFNNVKETDINNNIINDILNNKIKRFDYINEHNKTINCKLLNALKCNKSITTISIKDNSA